VGAVLESQALGIEVPASLSIAGYDDTEIMRELPIPITTIRVVSEEVGRRAAEVVVRLVEGGKPQGGVEIPAEIVARRSTGPAPS
jgi:LacI family transcriptional regulator